MYREWLEWERMHTWATSHNALSRKGIGAQLMNTKHSSSATKSSTKSSHNTIQSNRLPKETSNNVGPHQNPIYLARISITNFVILELWKSHSDLCKTKGNNRLLENWDGIKIVREKTWFLRFIQKRDSWELILWLRALEINLERNWDCEELLKDGILKKINK